VRTSRETKDENDDTSCGETAIEKEWPMSALSEHKNVTPRENAQENEAQ
jgi:hypothetical protein